MRIEHAKGLKVGDRVRCPPDRGDPAYIGKVTHLSADHGGTVYGTDQIYLWVTVEHPAGKSRHVWPSNRLGQV
jgi:hypothetical protein